MKKSRVILSILLVLVLLFTVAIAAACVENDDPNQGNQGNQGGDTPQPEVGSWELQKIAISGNYKKEYQVNEAFSAEGLKVLATMMNTETRANRTDDVTAKATVDSSRFNPAVVGIYDITISYTHEKVTRFENYSVKVLPYEPQVNGISMTKTTVEYNIPDGQLAINVNIDDITVKTINANGEEETTPLAADAYTLTYYKGGIRLDSLEYATRGAYTIQAERKSDGQTAFVIVNVLGGIDGITAETTQEEIELANDEATAVINTQDITVKTDGGDVVVANATTGPCTKIDYKLYSVAADKTETLLDDFTVGEGKYKVKITATYQIAANNTIDFTAEVTISVTVKFVGSRTDTYNLDLGAFSDKADKANLTQDDLTDGNAFLTHVGGTLQYRSNPVCLEIKNDTLSVTFEGTGTITIYARSTNSGDNKSSLYLKDKNGNYLTATYDTTITTAAEVAQDKGNVYTVVGGTICAFTFTVTESGTYTIGNMNVNGETGRNTRIMAIEMIDNVEA